MPVVEIEMSAGEISLPGIGGSDLLYVLLRWNGRPVGRLILEGSGIPPADAFRREALEASAAGILMAEIEEPTAGLPLESLGGPSPGGGPHPSEVSVIVATRDRPRELAGCLAALGALDPAPGEIVVVDSASARPDEIARTAARGHAGLVRLEEAGLSLARNAGAGAAGGSILAFLDDDCRADRGWIANLCAGFTDEAVEAVTGPFLPLEIETEAQRIFLRHSHMDLRGFVERRYDLAIPRSPHWPIDAWRMGSGGNLAIRASVLEGLGGFSPALGLGTPARGGEDLFLLWSIVQGGGAVVYRPGAMVWHRHHRTLEALQGVFFGYGAGHAAYLRAVRAAGAPRRALALYTLSFYADRLEKWMRSVAGLSPVPVPLVLREIAGFLAGGWLGREAEKRYASEGPSAEEAKPGSTRSAA